mmetsp:Transcript_8219/g.9568  ORF Transcript_8219/g.9568 Transcript_8219/m.9568 type:complete len:196 (-) Transcript_8219:81-668(-)|eukprot:CAMPEP_0204644942 /NCGR_PEP_ID=MMETSP0718-20130828/1833_1 /ASSEMBLY_ACC=CAM_ASM_000674 /TAXON_ID=230516 /ORGANISM="Chaetoceros curvisetus" /LENGTH=195 /DNA_ID=CAMNT_0051666649 /DNA_START=123 /DNA_END=710 /DNA_ORIENTATION=-
MKWSNCFVVIIAPTLTLITSTHASVSSFSSMEGIVRRKTAVSEECRQQTTTLWDEAEELNINLPDTSEASLFDYCTLDEESDEFICDLSDIEGNESLAPLCKDSGGQTVPLSISIGSGCFGQAGGESSPTVSFLNLNVCGGAGCTEQEIEDMTKTFMATLIESENCEIEVESAAYNQQWSVLISIIVVVLALISL